MKKILIVEDHLMFREIVHKVCTQSCPDAGVTEAESLNCAFRVFDEQQPELVILDLGLPDGDGLALIKHGRNMTPRTKFLIISAHCEPFTVFRLQRIGVDGFVDKDSSAVCAIADAIRAIANGEHFFSERFKQVAVWLLTHRDLFFRILSEKELEVLGLIAAGLADPEIGSRLGISQLTAKTHRGNIFRKLNIHTTPKLITFALRNEVVLGDN